ncbi:MAG: amidohydrolase family protein [Actinomycetota bacterium]|nr:amidohydrolase family protein [Actinomycetota bacterium]
MTRFIDTHVHPPVEGLLRSFAPYLPGLESHFGRPIHPMSPQELADYYRERDGRAVVLAWDAETATGQPPFTNREVARLVEEHPDVFIGFGSVDPNKGAAAVTGVHEAARLGLRGLKLHPGAQQFTLTEREMYPVWEAAVELGLICLVHTGFTGLGAGHRGGMGVRLHYARPLALDEVAAQFPELTIIAAHPSWPWDQEIIAIAQHKANVYLDLSGWSPKYFSPALLRAISGPLVSRTLFGSDFPFLTPDKWLKDWAGLQMPEDVTHSILVGNATELLDMK